MRHPEVRDLALYAGGELPLWKRLTMRGHVENCATCSAELAAFREAQLELQYASEQAPPDLNWNRIAAEMKANIRLGLEAGECVRTAPPPERHDFWRLAAVAAALTILVTGGWWWRIHNQTNNSLALRAPADQVETILKPTLGGIGVEKGGATFALAHSGGASLRVSADTKGVLKGGYVDEDSGEVTIHHVYAE